MYEVKLPVTHCPSNSGCRAVIKHAPDGNHEFQLTQNFHLTLRVSAFCVPRNCFLFDFSDQEQPGKGLWLDYVLVIPSEDYYPGVLQEEPLDQTGVFISQCGKNNFHMEPEESGRFLSYIEKAQIYKL
jgi:laminin, alpha 3/5